MRGVFLKRYSRFRKAVDFLKQLLSMDPDKIIEDYTLVSSLERNIQVVVEFIIDLSNYILSETTHEIPDTYKEIISRVSRVCSIEDSLTKEVKGIVGLRNIIVHLYADIDYDLVLSELKGIVDCVLEYTLKLTKCMDKLGIDP